MTHSNKHDRQEPINERAFAALVALARVLGRAAAREHLRALAKSLDSEGPAADQSRGFDRPEDRQ